MCRTKFFFNLVIIVTLVMAAFGNAAIVVRADNGNDELRADPRLLQMAEENPDATFMVIVQKDAQNKDLPDDDPEIAVEKGGGQVKKQLDLIVSFSADMTGKEIIKLAKHPNVRWISADAPLISTAAEDPRVRDDFGSTSYNNNNGTNTWSNGWSESGDDNSCSSGSVKISNGTLQLSGSNRSIKRQVGLSGAIYARLSFQYKRSSFDDSNDYVAIQVSKDGGSTWTERGRYAGSATDSAWLTANLFIQGDATTNTQIRFATSSSLGSSDIFYVDSVEIEYASASKYLSAIRADQVSSTLKGQGIGVAVVDSGINSHSDLNYSGSSRIIRSTNLTAESSANDGYGHGTVVAGIIGGNGSSSSGTYTGVAPRVDLVNVKVSDLNGKAYASDLVDGLQWIFNNKSTYNIKVVNLSMNSTIAESYETSPIDAAVEILWFNGIVVVVSAGNNGTGLGPVTMYPPANDPFVITVGAVSDKGTAVLSDDTMPFFSAYGTTEDRYAKPDLVAPGRNVVGLLASTSAIAYLNHPAHRVDANYFRMSGTSMAAPMVAGAAALLLQDEPNLNPDQVKYRLTATANKSWNGYDSVKAGAGYLDIYAAVNGSTMETANTGIDPSDMLTSGSNPISSGSVGWNSVGWNSVGWNSVGWNSVGWNSVGWNSNSAVWDD